MSPRELYRILRRMDRIGARLDSPEVRGPCMNLCWLNWMGRFSETMDLLPTAAYHWLSESEGENRPYVGQFYQLLAAARAA